MTRFARTAVCLLLTAALYSPGTRADSTRCPKQSLGDLYGWYHNSAHAALGPEHTSSKDSATIYVARTIDDKFYLHSNYVPDGAENPIKVLSDDTDNLDVLTEYLLDGEVKGKPRHKGVTYILDSSVFDSDGLLTVDAQWLQTAKVFNGRKGSIVAARRLRQERLPFSPWVTDYAPNLSTRVGIDPLALSHRLKEIPFDKSQVRVALLLDDSATAEAVQHAALPLLAHVTDESGVTDDTLEHMFAAAQGHTVVVFGHIWESSYVVHSAGKDSGILLPLAKLDSLAIKHNVTVVNFGCFSAASAAIGAENAVQSVVAVEALSAAVGAQDWDQFFRRLVSSKLQLVVRDEVGLRAVGPAPSRIVLDSPDHFGSLGKPLVTVLFATTLPRPQEVADDKRAPAIRLVGWSGLQIALKGSGLRQVLYKLQPDPLGLLVDRVDPEGPAFFGGVQTGDRIIRVNDAYGTTSDVEDGIAALGGPPGSIKRVRVKRDGKTKTFDFRLEPKRVQAEEEPEK